MARKVVPLLALIALGLLLSDASATGSTPENDFSEEEVQFAEVPSKDAASRDPTEPEAAKKPVTKAHAEKAKAPAKHAAKKVNRSVLPKQHSEEEGTYDEAEDRIRDFDKMLSHDEHKALKGQGLVEEPLEDEEDPAVEQLNEEQEADQDEQASADAFDELADAMPEETGEEADTPQAHVSDPHGVEMEQVAKQQKASQVSKHIKNTLDRIKKLGIRSKTSTPTMALAEAQKKKRGRRIAQLRKAMRVLPSAAPTKTSASGLQEKEDEAGASLSGPQTWGKSKHKKWFNMKTWKLGAGESYGGHVNKARKKVSTRAAIVQAANANEGADRDHPNKLVNFEFRSMPGKYRVRRLASVYSRDPDAPLPVSTVMIDKISDIDPASGRFVAP